MRNLALGMVAVLGNAWAVVGQTADPLDTAFVPSLSLHEVARIGGHDLRAEYLFDGIRDIAILGPDVFAILDAGSNEVRMFGTDGNLMWKRGGEGRGPGEFVSARRLSPLPQGRLMVWDGRLQRATVIDSGGAVESTASADFGPMALFFAGFVGVMPDGSWIQRLEPNPSDLRDEPEGARRDTVVFVRVSADGRGQDPVTAVLGPTRVLTRYNSTSWVRERPILGRDLISVVRADTLLVVDTDSLSVSRFAPDGTVLVPHRLQRPPRASGRRLQEAARAELVAEAEARSDLPQGTSLPGMAALQSGQIETLKNILAEESVPALADLLVGGDDSLWIREYRLPGEPNVERWFRMGDDFRPDAWLELPEDHELLGAGYGIVTSVVTDHLGVETVVVHGIR